MLKETRPFAPFEWMLAGRYLRARRREGFISVIAGFSFAGIMLGVATLIIVMAVMNGFRSELLNKVLGLNGHIAVYSQIKPFDNFDEVTKKLRRVEGVISVLPLVEGQVMVSADRAATGGLVRGIREADLKSLKSVAGNIRQGSLDGFDKKEGLAIGVRMAEDLGLIAGDAVTLISPRGAVTPFGVAPQVKRYPIVAVFEIGMSEYDRSVLFMPLAEAQLYFNAENEVTVLEMLVEDPDGVGELRPKLMRAAGPGIRLKDWRERNSSIFNALQVERNVMFLVLTMIVLVAAFNIISGLIMLVKDKSGDIGILRTMGATQGAVMRVFLITGASIGVTGTLAGFGLGVLVCVNIEPIRRGIGWLTNTDLFSPELYYLSQLPADMNTGQTAAVVIMALVLSLLATLYPSWRAARLDPVEALRYE